MKANNRKLKTKFSSLDVCAMAQSVSPLVSGYRISNIYDVNPRTCARICHRSSVAPSSLLLACSDRRHARPPPSQVCA
jgi:predicted ribosome quality control (RQC) complex YloA/Tae2 family protein